MKRTTKRTINRTMKRTSTISPAPTHLRHRPLLPHYCFLSCIEHPPSLHPSHSVQATNTSPSFTLNRDAVTTLPALNPNPLLTSCLARAPGTPKPLKQACEDICNGPTITQVCSKNTSQDEAEHIQPVTACLQVIFPYLNLLVFFTKSITSFVNFLLTSFERCVSCPNIVCQEKPLSELKLVSHREFSSFTSSNLNLE